jgi:hypothetical protein
MRISFVFVFELTDKPFLFCIDKEDKLNLDEECDWESSTESLSEKLSRLNCELKRNHLMMQLKFDDSYFKMDGLVFHALQGTIFATNCVPIYQIQVHEHVTTCSNDIFISFVYNGETKNGFVTNERIIRKKSKQEACSSEPKYLTVGADEQLVRIKDKITVLRNESFVNWSSASVETFLSTYESWSTTPIYRAILDCFYIICLTIWLVYSAIFSASPKLNVAFKAMVKCIYFR